MTFFDSSVTVAMPSYLVIIYNTTMGELFCLNYEKLNENIEPKVTTYIFGVEEQNQTFEIITDSFDGFLLDRVRNEF